MQELLRAVLTDKTVRTKSAASQTAVDAAQAFTPWQAE